MRMEIYVTLDAGGKVLVTGQELNAESIHELFTLLSGYAVEVMPFVEEEEE